MRDKFTLADLVEITGAKRRSVQLWAEAGALVADSGTERAGTGVHRRFNRREAIIANILSALSRLRISIGVMVSIADTTRWVMSQGDAINDFEQCVAGKNTVYLFYGAAKREAEFTMHYLTIDDGDDVDRALGESVRKQEGTHSNRVVIAVNLNPHLSKLR
jgi:hypothetical protein